MYRAQYPNDNAALLVSDDIKNISGERVPFVTLATASFPCNDLSSAGTRNGLDGSKSGTFWHFVNVLERMRERRPPLVLIENVTGFLSSNNGRDLTLALWGLNSLGYTVDAFIIDAKHFVPQSRRRLFIVGTLNNGTNTSKGQKLISEPKTTAARPKALIDFILRHPEVHWTIRALPDLPEAHTRLESVLEDVPHSSAEWWDEQRANYLFEQMSSKHQAIAKQMIASPKWSYGTVFRRMRNHRSSAELRTDGIAGCLRVPRGGSAKQILFKAGFGQYYVRLITPREAACLMGANEFTISVSLDQALLGFGDAVCVPVVEWVAHDYLNPLLTELVQT